MVRRFGSSHGMRRTAWFLKCRNSLPTLLQVSLVAYAHSDHQPKAFTAQTSFFSYHYFVGSYRVSVESPFWSRPPRLEGLSSALVTGKSSPFRPTAKCRLLDVVTLPLRVDK
jgi:hypothetical protein